MAHRKQRKQIEAKARLISSSPPMPISQALAQSVYQYPIATKPQEQRQAWVSDFGYKPGLWSSVPYRTLWTTWRAIIKGPDSSDVVNTCIQRLAWSVASVPWVIERDTGNGVWERFPQHPLNALCKRPNPRMTMRAFMARTVWHLNLSGNSLAYKNRGIGTQTQELWPLIPDALYPVPDADDYLTEYRTAPLPQGMSQFPQSFAPEDILHMQLDPDPLNQFWGLSPLERAQGLIETDRKARDWNRHALSHRTVPDGILASKMPLTEDQYNNFKSAVEAHQGPEGAREMIVLSAEVQYIPVAAMSAVDLDYIAGRKMTQEQLCAVFRVPPILLSPGENATFENMSTAREMLWEDTVLPILGMIQDELNTSVAAEWGDGIRFAPDYAKVPAMRTILAKSVPIAQGLTAMGVPFTHVNDRLSLGIQPFAGDDVGMVGGASAGGPQPMSSFVSDPMGGVPPKAPALPAPIQALVDMIGGEANASPPN